MHHHLPALSRGGAARKLDVPNPRKLSAHYLAAAWEAQMLVRKSRQYDMARLCTSEVSETGLSCLFWPWSFPRVRVWVWRVGSISGKVVRECLIPVGLSPGTRKRGHLRVRSERNIEQRDKNLDQRFSCQVTSPHR